MEKISRGQVWQVTLNPTIGHEQGGVRPTLVLSVDPFNNSPADLVIVLPITSRSKNVRSHVEILPPEASLTLKSWIKCEDIRSISKQRLIHFQGEVSPKTLQEVEIRVRFLLGI